MSHAAHQPAKIRTHPTARVVGLALLVLAIAVAIGAATLVLVRHHPVWWRFEGVAAALALMGLWARFAGHEIRLDWAARQLRVRRQILPFAELAHVELRSVTVEKSTAQGTSQHTRYQVLLVRAADPELVAQVAGMRKRLDAAVTSDQAPMNTAEQVSLAAEAERLRPARATDAVVAFEHADELRLWRAAEAVAKTLDLPVIDFAGDTVVVRTPAELDLPLGRRLARLHVPLADPGPAPAGLSEQRTAAGICFTWRFNVWPPVIGLTLLAALLAGLAWVIWADLWDLRLGMAGLAGVLLLWAGRLALGMRRVLTLGRAFVSYRPGLWPRRSLRLPIAELELVRISRAHPDTIGLVSDRRLVRVRLPPTAADWLRRRLELLLREQASG